MQCVWEKLDYQLNPLNGHYQDHYSDSDSSCTISLHISDVNCTTYVAACTSGVLCSNLFKRTLLRIMRHSP